MSSTLYWEPVILQKGRDLDDELKWIMQEKYGTPVNAVLDNADIPYLQGIVDAGLLEAQKLITAIRRYGRIELKEEY